MSKVLNFPKPEGSAAGRYEALTTETKRDAYVARAERCAALTLPSLFPKDASSGSTSFETPHQSFGARGVNNLKAKFLLSLFPPNSPFFRLKLDTKVAEELKASGEEATGAFETALTSIEKSIQDEFEAASARVTISEALAHAIVAGNCLLHEDKDGKWRLFTLKQYVCLRDPNGTVREIVVKESVARASLPRDVRSRLKSNEDDSTEKTVDLFTWIRKRDSKWYIHQEAEGQIIADSRGQYKKEDFPWIPIRLNKVDGEDYGRSFVEEYLGDLISLEGLSKAILEAAAASAKVVFLIAPNSPTANFAKQLNDAPNLAFLVGRAEDISCLQVNKATDLSVAYQELNKIENRLGHAFLLNTAIRRDAERVTAEEVRLMAQELEDALGGAYSVLSQELQLPLVRRLMARMQKDSKIPSLPDNTVNPTIVTGMEALGRSHDYNRLRTALQGLVADIGPEAVAKHINTSEFIARTLTALGVNLDGLVRSEEELNQEAQAAMSQQMLSQLGPNAVNQMGGIMQKGMEQNGTQAQELHAQELQAGE